MVNMLVRSVSIGCHNIDALGKCFLMKMTCGLCVGIDSKTMREIRDVVSIK